MLIIMQPTSDSRRAAGPVDAAIAALQRLSELFLERRRQLAREAGLTDGQWRVFEEIADEHFMPSLFARRRDCAPAAVSRSLRGLLEAGLVSVEVGPQDGRRRIYRLTPAGRSLQERLRARREAAIAAVWQGFGRAELARFTEFAHTLSDALEAYAREQDPAAI
jgi:DNA-binding MarR family transcriptional regulator